jgi:hypothetical protein
MPYATSEGIEEKFIGSARSALSITAGFSLFALLLDAYELPTVVVVERLVDIYDQLLASTLGRIAEQLNLLIARLGYSYEIPLSWKHLFVWLAFYFSTIRYYPLGQRSTAKIVQWFFLIYALCLTFVTSFVASAAFPEPYGLFASSASASILMAAIYPYYFVQHLYRATFDRPLENQLYGNSDTWRQYFFRQERGTLQIFLVFAVSVSAFGLLSFFTGFTPRVSLLLAVFSIFMMVFGFSLGWLNAIEWSRQDANKGVSRYQLFLRAGNTKIARNFMVPIAVTVALVMLGYLLAPLHSGA